MEVDYLDLVGEGYMGSMQWQLGREMGTIPAFASRTQENRENLGREKTWVQLITNLNVILYLSTCHTVYISVLILFMIMP